jgi:hypothetical protein
MNSATPEIYRANMTSARWDPDYFVYGTQDQGTQNCTEFIPGGFQNVEQSVGGDSSPYASYDGLNIWTWKRTGANIKAPVKLYGNDGKPMNAFRFVKQYKSSPVVEFTSKAIAGWANAYFDHDQPGHRMWLLARKLIRAEYFDGQITGLEIDTSAGGQVAALAQAWQNPDIIYMLQGSKVFISTNRGDSFGNPIDTPFTPTQTNGGGMDFGAGVVLPSDDNWILFCGPSRNSVGSILSTDGGQTWEDVTGDFPAGGQIQTSGMVVTHDSKYVFAGTNLGPYLFVVAEKKWYSM